MHLCMRQAVGGEGGRKEGRKDCSLLTHPLKHQKRVVACEQPLVIIIAL